MVMGESPLTHSCISATWRRSCTLHPARNRAHTQCCTRFHASRSSASLLAWQSSDRLLGIGGMSEPDATNARPADWQSTCGSQAACTIVKASCTC